MASAISSGRRIRTRKVLLLTVALVGVLVLFGFVSQANVALREPVERLLVRSGGPWPGAAPTTPVAAGSSGGGGGNRLLHLRRGPSLDPDGPELPSYVVKGDQVEQQQQPNAVEAGGVGKGDHPPEGADLTLLDTVKGTKKLVDGAMRIVDMVMGTSDDERVIKAVQEGKKLGFLDEVRGMLTFWNPEASRWAVNASAAYKEAVARRAVKPDAWKFLRPEETTFRKVTLEGCGCQRTIRGHASVMLYDGTEGNGTVSTCSRSSYLRGFKQRVIGFSYYANPGSSASGVSEKYFGGIKQNLDLLPRFYDGWTVRLYHDVDQENPLFRQLCDLACGDPNVDLCYVKALPALGDTSKVFPMNWRFLPMLDPQVTHLLSRDLDSRFSDREVSAVKDWLWSPPSGGDLSAFHVMRDHPAHSVEMLGSSWGVRMGFLERRFLDEAFSAALKDPIFWAKRSAYSADQAFLKRFIWPWAKWSMVSHDSYTCAHFPRTRPFPEQRVMVENNYISAVVEANSTLKLECPLKCRPKAHQDWIYC